MENFICIQNSNSEIIDKILESKGVDISLIPRNPMIRYYDNNDNLIHESNCENDFYAIRLMIDNNNLKGYYFTIETEWWDDSNEYQGSNGAKNYKRYHFNCDDAHNLEASPCELFAFPFDCINAIFSLK